MADEPSFLIQVRPLPSVHGEGTVYRRLARVLKWLKRTHGFICVSVEEAKDGSAQGSCVRDLAARPEAQEEAQDGDLGGIRG